MLSKDSKDDSELALQIWKNLQQFTPVSEEDIRQCRIDLSHVLSVFIRVSDWSSCSQYLRSPNCNVSHIALVLRGIARSEKVDKNYLSSLYMDYRDIIYHSVDSSTMKDVLYVIDLMLDICSLYDDSALLSVVINDVLTSSEAESVDITNKLFSRLVRLSIEKDLTESVYSLYMFQNGKFCSMTRIYRLIERYMRGLKTSDEATSKMKQRVLNLHYSNPTEEESANTPDVDEEYLEPSVLEVLKGFDPNKMQIRSKNDSQSRIRSQGRSQDHSHFNKDSHNRPLSKNRFQGNSHSRENSDKRIRSQEPSHNGLYSQDHFHNRYKENHSSTQGNRSPTRDHFKNDQKGNSFREKKQVSEERDFSHYYEDSRDHYHKGFK